MRSRIPASLAIVALTFAAAQPIAASSASLAQERAAPPKAPADGSIVDHTFRTKPLNANGVKSLADLRGRPVLIEFWGVR